MGLVNPEVYTWNGGLVCQTADEILKTRQWDLVPLLADFLEEAGCSHPEIIKHFRDGMRIGDYSEDTGSSHWPMCFWILHFANKWELRH